MQKEMKEKGFQMVLIEYAYYIWNNGKNKLINK